MNVITNQQVFSLLAPRAPESHKGTYGRVLAVCGSAPYRGAAALSVLGALRAGAGIVTLAAPENVLASVTPRILEATCLPLPDDEALFSLAGQVTACLIGCGLAENDATARQTQRLVQSARGTLVLDAGGLCSLSDAPQALRPAAGRLVVTPHPGEMARLAHCTVREVQADRPGLAARMARELSAVVVLKGHRTHIAAPDGTLWENRTGNPGLARGGSGDVLAGMIAGFAAQGLRPLDAALCGVYLHGLAADRCAARLSRQGMLPEDLLCDLCGIFLENGR